MAAGPALPRPAQAGAVQQDTPAAPRRARLPLGAPVSRYGPIAARLRGLGAARRAQTAGRPGDAPARGRARMSGASSWSFREEDAVRIGALLDSLLREANAKTALLVDRTGQMLA